MKTQNFSYDIEQLYIEGYRPEQIAGELGCSVGTVYEWVESINLEWNNAFPDDFDPFRTVNS